MAQSMGMKIPFSLLKKRSDCHPSKRKDEIARFGNPEFQIQVCILLELISVNYTVKILQDNNLALAIVRGVAMYQSSKSDTGEWVLTADQWEGLSGLKRHRLDGAKKLLMDNGELQGDIRDFPPTSYYQYFYPQEDLEVQSEFQYYHELAHLLGHDATALFGWLLELDKQSEAQGYFFHLKMADIQQSLGLSRYQVDQARKKLIEHDLLKERFWGIPAVREFRLRLDGLEQLVAEKGALE
ncbi:MAG: hypothetical protein ABW107_17560 [Candidatus Thiodiazotropha sp. 6PLUC5]